MPSISVFILLGLTRRMLTSVGNEVKHLHRLSTEDMLLSQYNLQPGEYCSITIEEINRLIFHC